MRRMITILLVVLFTVSLVSESTLQAQPPRVLLGHTDAVYGISFSPDGRRLATGSYDQTIRLWDVNSRRVVHVLKGHEDQIFRIAFSPDGKQVTSCGADGTVRIWNVVSGKSVAVLEAGSLPVMALGYSADGKRLATGDYAGELTLWNVQQRKRLRSIQQPTPILSIAVVSMDAKQHVLSGDNQGMLRCWRADSGELTGSRRFNEHGALYGLSVDPTGNRIAVGGSRGLISLLRGTQLDLRQSPIDAGGGLFDVAFSKDGKQMAAGGRSRFVRVWRLTTDEFAEPRQLRGPQETVLSIAFSPDGRRLAGGCYDGEVYLWRLK